MIRWIAMLVVVGMISFVGCGPEKGGSETTPEDTTTQEQTTDEGAAETTAETAEEGS